MNEVRLLIYIIRYEYNCNPRCMLDNAMPCAPLRTFLTHVIFSLAFSYFPCLMPNLDRINEPSLLRTTKPFGLHLGSFIVRHARPP